MPFADLSAATIHHDQAGDGPPLLVINGTGSDLRNKPNPLQWPIVKQHTVLAYDHRGLGQSTPHEPGTQPTMADFAADAAELVDHVGWERFAVLGISFGGMVAQELAIAAADRVSKLVLACTSSGGDGGASYPLHELYAGPAAARGETYLDIADLRHRTDPALLDRARAAMAARPMPEIVPDGLTRQLEARRHHDTWERLHQITCPTFVMFGRHDGVAPPENSEALARQIPDARLSGYEGGHMFLAQDRSSWTDLLAFLTD